MSKPNIPKFYKYAECRLGHRWVLRPDHPARQAVGGWLFVWDCEGCGGEKRQYSTHRGEVRPAYYILPDGYRLKAGLRKANFRVYMINEHRS